MNQNGFTLIETLVAISILTLFLFFSSTLYLTLEHLHQENVVNHQIMVQMEMEINKWRNNEIIASENIIIDHISVSREVEQYMLSPSIEKADVTYRWKINKKEFQVLWEIERINNE